MERAHFLFFTYTFFRGIRWNGNDRETASYTPSGGSVNC